MLSTLNRRIVLIRLNPSYRYCVPEMLYTEITAQHPSNIENRRVLLRSEPRPRRSVIRQDSIHDTENREDGFAPHIRGNCFTTENPGGAGTHLRVMDGAWRPRP